MPEPMNTPKMIQADNFLRGYGIMGDVQWNNLILTSLCACKRIKNIAYDYDPKKTKELKVTVYLGLWSLLFSRKNKIIDILVGLYNEYLPAVVNIEFKFKRYGRRKKRTSSS